jgi:anthranilate/para-aminobenzoate synthase component I
LNETDNRYRELRLPVLADCLAAVVRLAEDAGDRGYVCFEGEEGWCVGVGRAAELVADRERIVLRGRDGRAELPWDRRSMAAVPRLLATAGIAGWRAYGWCGFDLAAAKEGRLDLVGDRPFLHLVIPEIEVRMGPSSTVVRALRAADQEWARTRLQAGTATVAEPARPNGSGLDPLGERDTGRRDYEAAVERALRAIELGRLEKVVLSRKIPVSVDTDLVGTFAAGRRQTSPARSFLFALGGVEAAGLSPESVVRVSGAGAVTCELLAGTRAATGFPNGGAPARDELLRDPKEVFEHAISVRARHRLRPGLGRGHGSPVRQELR